MNQTQHNKCRIAFAAISIALATILAHGCNYVNSPGKEAGAKLENEVRKSDTPNDVKPTKKVRWDGGGIIIGETDSLAFDIDTFVDQSSQLIKAERFASIADLVTHYPDIALQTLQEANVTTANRTSLGMVANLMDQRFCDSKAWQKYVEDVAGLPKSGKRRSEKLDARTRFWRYLKNHQADEAVKLRLTKTLNRDHGVMLRAEFLRLEAIAAMMSGDHEASVKGLEQAIALVDGPCPYLASKLKLLLGEFYRHADRFDEWKQTWESAIVQHSQLANGKSWFDPQFWNRAAFLRPAGLKWPAEAMANLKGSLRDLDLVDTERGLRLDSNESLVWFAIGYHHLHRLEGQNAILAFKKAEAAATNQHSTKAMQLYQARALVAAGQPGAASAILFRMVSVNEGTALADRAKAILATMKLQNGSVEQGLNLIQSAIVSVERWPADEQRSARADYALALLVRGRESAGLEQLKVAQQAFQEAGDQQQVRQCLWNLAKYYEKTEQKEPLRSASRELVELERRVF